MKKRKKYFLNLIILALMTTQNQAKAEGFDEEKQKEIMELLIKDIPVDSAEIALSISDGGCSDKVAEVKAEAYIFAAKFAKLLSQIAILYASAPKYPTVCSVFTEKLNKKYTQEIKEKRTGSFSIAQKPFPISVPVEYEEIKPDYYWPYYFIEVTDKANDVYKGFNDNDNEIYIKSRELLADPLLKFIDKEGVKKLYDYVLDFNVIEKSKSLIGSEENITFNKSSINHSYLDRSSNENKDFGNNGITASGGKTSRTFDANIWPVTLSKAFGDLTMCSGYNLPKMIGYDWKLGEAGIPNTCPISMARDMYPYWETGILDYLNPKAVTSVLELGNKKVCAAEAMMNEFAKITSSEGSLVGDALSKAENLNVSKKLRALVGCSLPITGGAEAIASTVLKQTDPENYTLPWCTFWGHIAPRQYMSVHNNEYTFANTALKYETLSQQIHAVPKLENEKWALAFPWEDNVNNEVTTNINGKKRTVDLAMVFDTIKNSIGSDAFKDQKNLIDRSNNLFLRGDPRLINTSFNPSYFNNRIKTLNSEVFKFQSIRAKYNIQTKDQVISEVKHKDNYSPGDRRIYTAFSHEKCTIDAVKVKIKVAGYSVAGLTEYWANKNDLGSKSCGPVIRYEVSKYFQKKYLHKICKAIGKSEGEPFKSKY